jgi:DNA-binding NtrC family response regulator
MEGLAKPKYMANKKQKVENEMNPLAIDIVSPGHFPESQVINLKVLSKKAAEEAEREHIRNTLSYTNWNRKAAAKLLQVSYKALLYKIENYQLNEMKNHNGNGQ